MLESLQGRGVSQSVNQSINQSKDSRWN